MLRTKEKTLAVSLTVLVVLSVFVSGIVLAANVQRGGTSPQFNPGIGGPNTVVVDESKPVIFQGEDNLDFVNEAGNPVTPSNLVGVAGAAEGVPLELPVPQDQDRGQYTLDGTGAGAGVTVQTPRVTDLSVLNERGIDVEGSTVQEDEILLVSAEWNFEQAEDLSLEVRDEDGNEVTGDVLGTLADLSEAQRGELTGAYAQFPEAVEVTGQRGTGTGIEYLQGVGQFNQSQLANTSVDSAYWVVDLSDQPSGDYTINVEGWSDLDFGPASRTTAISLTTEDDVTIDLDEDTATRGQNVRFTIRGSVAGAQHVVTIEDDDFRNNQVDRRVFRTIQDTIERGTLDTNGDGTEDVAYAIIEINEDTGLGVGQIDTSFLDDTNVDLNVYQADRSLQDVANNTGDTEDDLTLDVREGQLQFQTPAGSYISGQEIDVLGTAAPGVDDVAIYARDEGDWELLDINEDGQLNNEDTISVDADGEWERQDVVLSDASDIFSIPGRYRIGVVELQDALDNQGNLRQTLTTSQFSSATSEQSSIFILEPGLTEVETFRTFNGQVATDDGTVDVVGTAPGLEDVLVVMVDERGRVATDRVTVDDDDVFDQDDIPLTTFEGRELSEGEVRGFVIGLGRDGVAGDGVVPAQTSADISALEDYINSFGVGLTQQQVTERILDETTDDVASDDLLLEQDFRYADGRTTIEAVGPEGENVTGINDVSVGDTMVVQGLTNRKADDNTITVEVVDGPSAGQFETASTDQWLNDGVWSVALEVPDDVEPGLYTVEADDGDQTDTVQVRITAAGNVTETPSNVTETPSNVTETPGNATGTPSNATETPGNESRIAGPGAADASMTGALPLGVAMAALAALAGALVARREL